MALKKKQPSKAAKKDKKQSKAELDAVKDENFRHRQFAREYVLNMGNATAAYKIVYGAEVKGAEVSASRLLTNANVQRIIEDERKYLETKYRSSVDEVLEYLFAVVLMDPKTMVDEDPETGEQRWKLLRHMPLQARRALEISGKGKSVYFKQVERNDAWDWLFKYLGLDNAGSGSGTGRYSGKDALERIRKYLDRGDKSR